MSNTNGAVKQNFAQAWKKQTMVVEFPSGLMAEMTRPNALAFLTERDDVPDFFFAIMTSSTPQEAQEKISALSPEQQRDYTRMLSHFGEQLMVEHSVNPLVVTNKEPNYEEGECSLDDVKAIDFNDKQWLINWGMFGGTHVEALKRFRDEQAKRLHALQNGGDLSQNTL